MRGVKILSTFNLPKLPYEYDELEPFIDARTLEIHHGKHHATYVNNLNIALEGQEDLQGKSLAYLLSNLDTIPEEIRTAVRNHGGGHFSHSLFWEVMSPTGGGDPNLDIENEINRHFGNFDKFQSELSNAAISRFGSGYGWLVMDEKKELSVMSTANQDTPMMVGKTPLLVVDVWEHAYYLKYQNRRPEFIENWWKTVNWEYVNALYNDAKNVEIELS